MCTVKVYVLCATHHMVIYPNFRGTLQHLAQRRAAIAALEGDQVEVNSSVKRTKLYMHKKTHTNSYIGIEVIQLSPTMLAIPPTMLTPPSPSPASYRLDPLSVR